MPDSCGLALSWFRRGRQPRLPDEVKATVFCRASAARCTFGGRSIGEHGWFMVSYCRFRPSPHVYALPGAGVRWWLICSIEWYVRAARTPCLRRLSCQSVRSNPTIVGGPRLTVSGCGCAPGLAARSSPSGAARAAPSSLPECCVLPAAHRMRRSGDFATAIRSGRRAGSRRLVVHVATTDEAEPTRIGLVVSKQVGNSVVRHRVARQLRAIAAERLAQWPAGQLMVIRALPSAHGSPARSLSSDLDRALSRLAVGQ